MLTSEQTHPAATLVINRDEATDRVQIGVDLDGVFVPFFETKLSLFDTFHAQGLEQKAALPPEPPAPAAPTQTQ